MINTDQTISLVIAKAEELNTDMKFIGQMASVSFASLGDDILDLKNIMILNYFS